ncbi:uncharacterized protein [Argopecten irradians]|uniref:uncharacterized protein n=1 Tax=Argopecten irradians TaxID=31199 RepID=UPI00371CE3F7
MKLLVALTLCLALTTTVQGSSFMDSLKQSFSHIGDAFTQTFHYMGQQATDVGKQLLNQAAEQGKQLLGQTAHNLLVNTISAFQGTSAPATKRELSALTQLLQPYRDMIDAKSHQLQGLFQTALGKLEEVSHQITELSPAEISSKVDGVTDSYNVQVGHVLHDLQSALMTHHKRAVADTLSAAGNKIVSMFSTHLHALNEIIHGAGSLIKQESSTVGQTMAETLGQLNAKLSKQMATMGTSGHVVANALEQVMHQVVSGTQPDVLQ